MTKESTIKFPTAFNKAARTYVVPKASDGANPVYDETRDKGNLVCPHCLKAALHFNKGAETVAGDNLPGQRPHFKTNPRSPHAPDCLATVLVQDEGYDPDKIDFSKGWKIYLNMGILRQAFRPYAAVVARSASGRIDIRDPDLLDRETGSAKTPKDFVKFMTSGQNERLNESKIVHGNTVTKWQDFFIRKGQGKDHPFGRWINLSRQLIEGHDHPCLFHLDLTGIRASVLPTRKGNRMRFSLDSIVTTHPETGGKITVIPLVQVRNEHMFDMFRENKEFLALALPRIYEGTTAGTWFMDIDLSSPGKVMAASLSEIALTSKEKARERRGETGGPAPQAAGA